MYPWSSTSSTSQQSSSIIPNNTSSSTTPNNLATNFNNLTRYGSAPSSFFQTAVDSVLQDQANNFFPGPGSGGIGGGDVGGGVDSTSTAVLASTSTTGGATSNNYNINNMNDHHHQQHQHQHQHHHSNNKSAAGGGTGVPAGGSASNLQRSFNFHDIMNSTDHSGGFTSNNNNNSSSNLSGTMPAITSTRVHQGQNGGGGAAGSSSNLTRHSSSPAGFLQQLTSDIGFSMTTKGNEAYNSNIGRGGSSSHKLSRLSAHQLNFNNNAADSHSHMQEVNDTQMDGSHHHDLDMNHNKRSAAGFSINNAWDAGSSNSFVISASSSSKRNRNNINDDILNDLSAIDSQLYLPHGALEMATMDTMMNIPPDSVPCKIRAKRGFATHPRSIAERERRTRISGKLKKLQELVPNMDKQTSYADMLDLAVDHIKGLQSQITKLHTDFDNCTCGCKQKL